MRRSLSVILLFAAPAIAYAQSGISACSSEILPAMPVRPTVIAANAVDVVYLVFRPDAVPSQKGETVREVQSAVNPNTDVAILGQGARHVPSLSRARVNFAREDACLGFVSEKGASALGAQI
jgi:hypothetical protein